MPDHAASRPELRVAAEDEPGRSEGAPTPAQPEPRRPSWRRALRFLKPPAITLRGFLQAPMHGRLNDINGELVRRTDRLADQLETLQRFNETAAAMLHRLEADSMGLHRSLLQMHQDLGPVQDGLTRLSAETQRNRERLEMLEDDLRRRLPPIEQSIRDIPGMFGPRFDEMEAKIRPPVPYGDGRVAIRLADGYVVAPTRDPAVVTMLANATSGGFEPGTRRRLVKLLEPGMGVADVGANIGLLTVAAARVVGPAGKVFAFEPEDEPRDCLARTLHLNGLPWVDLSAAAVGRETGPQTFHVSPILGHSSLYALPAEEGASREVKVDVVRLDDVVPRRQRLDVVKIDVEGAELDVLAGMTRLFEANPDLAVIAEYGPSHLARVGIAPKEWMDAFRAHGLRPHLISEADGACRRVALRDLARVESVNLAFVRPGGAAEKRLFT